MGAKKHTTNCLHEERKEHKEQDNSMEEHIGAKVLNPKTESSNETEQPTTKETYQTTMHMQSVQQE